MLATITIIAAVANELAISHAGALTDAQHLSQYATHITAAAKSAFLESGDHTYIAGITAVLIGD